MYQFIPLIKRKAIKYEEKDQIYCNVLYQGCIQSTTGYSQCGKEYIKQWQCLIIIGTITGAMAELFL